MTETGLVGDWYNQHAALEHDRLHKYRLEFAVSLRVILQTLGSLKSNDNERIKILDLGGGTGRYGMATDLTSTKERLVLSREDI